MADHTDHTNNTYRETRVEERRGTSGGALAFIVGGLVVAVAVIAWLFTGDDVDVAGSGGGAGSDISVNVDNPAPSGAVDGGEVADPAPAGAVDGGGEVAAPAD